MHYLIRSLRAFSTSSAFLNATISTRFPRPVLEMSPKYRFLNASVNLIKAEQATQSLFAEVLRCHSYFDETVFLNTVKLMMTKSTGTRADGLRLAQMRFAAIVYHSINHPKHRETLKNAAEHLEKCKIPMLRAEQDLFFSSIYQSDNIPTFTSSMHTSDLVLCYFRREIEFKNWENIKKLLILHPKFIPLYDHIEVFLEVGKQRTIPPKEVLDIFMEYSKTKNPYFMEHSEFERSLQKIINSYSFHISENHQIKEKSHISIKDANTLKQRIDEYVKSSKEGFVRTQEYEQVAKRVSKWKKERKIKNGLSVVVVDALNFGLGQDPKEWKHISHQFEQVFFASRTPPKEIREKVFKRYDGSALFCDKLSADDLVILRMALEFGPETSLVTNDRYRDHRQMVCQGDSALEKIWDDFLIDAVYRHFDGRIEARRDFNLRIRTEDTKWFIPVLDSEGHSSRFRRLKVYCIDATSHK